MKDWNLTPIPARVTERAITRVIEQDDGCWISLYSTASHGYAQIGWQDAGSRHVVLAHRAAWTHVEGEVPPDMTQVAATGPWVSAFVGTATNCLCRGLAARWPVADCGGGASSASAKISARTGNERQRDGVHVLG